MPIEDGTLLARIDVNYKPIPGWAIFSGPVSGQYGYRFTGSTTDVLLGDGFGWPREAPATFGLHRTSLMEPKLRFDPDGWKGDFRYWPELMYPTAWAESDANFLVVNCWDNAAITVTFLQLAAHTEDDMIPLFRRLLAELPLETKKWFPELGLIAGKVCYVSGDRYKSLEEPHAPTDGIEMPNWARGDFMQFFNPNRKAIDQEELHASARWVEWTRQSAAARKAQVAEAIENMKDSVKVLHDALLHSARDRYPKGVDGMRCDYLSAALAVPHWSPSAVDKAVLALTRTDIDIIDAFEVLHYGPSSRAKDVVDGVRQRRSRLKTLQYDLSTGEPIVSPQS
jgi:hypothetical protein